MNTLNLSLKTTSRATKPIVEVDGKVINPNKVSAVVSQYVYETDRDEANIKIYSSPNELMVEHWFGWFIIYYLMSFFGIFDRKYSKNSYSYCYECNVKLCGDTFIDVGYNLPKEGGKVFVAKDGGLEDNDTNKYLFDGRVKKRHGIALAFKIVSWILILLIIILAITL